MLCSKTLTPTDRVIARRHFCFPRELTRAAELPRSQDRSREGGGGGTLWSCRINAAVYCKEGTRGTYRAKEPNARPRWLKKVVRWRRKIGSYLQPVLRGLPPIKGSSHVQFQATDTLCAAGGNSVAPLPAEHSNAHREQHWYSTSTARLTMTTLSNVKQLPRNI